MAEDIWPDLPFNSWKDTYATLHMWTQVVGKIAVKHGPALNHSWGSAMRVTPRGLTTRTLYDGVRSFAFEVRFHRPTFESANFRRAHRDRAAQGDVGG